MHKRYNFDLEADTYDDFYNTQPGRDIDFLEKKLIRQFLEQFKQKEILEIGCGTGHWSAFFAENGFTVNGIDVSKKMLEKAIEKKIPNATFTQALAEELPFKKHSIENIACITALEFMNDITKAITEMHRVLKPGGILLVGALNKNSFQGKNKNASEVFKDAHFFFFFQLYNYLLNFGIPETAGCVVQDIKGNILDLDPMIVTEEQCAEEGAFLVGIVKKTKTANPK